MGLGTPETPWVTVLFKGGAIHTEQHPDIEIFMSRHNNKKIEYIILGGKHIEGHLIEDIRGHLLQTKTRYV